jgi:phage gpG-like protein
MQDIVKIDDKSAVWLFDELIDRGSEPPLDEIGRYMVKSVQQNFKEDGRPDKWPERSESTRSWNYNLSPVWGAFSPTRDEKGRFKKNLTGNWPLLRKTGRMYDSIDYTKYGDQNASAVSIGDDSDYGVYHNIGTKKMPKRQFLLIQDEDYDAIGNIIETMFV